MVIISTTKTRTQELWYPASWLSEALEAFPIVKATDTFGVEFTYRECRRKPHYPGIERRSSNGAG